MASSALRKLAVVLGLVLVTACGASEPFDPADDTDQVADGDGGDGDAGPSDVDGDGDGGDDGDDADGLPTDQEPSYPLDGFGQISDDCPSIMADMLTSPDPSLVRLSIDFLADPFDRNSDAPELTLGGQAVLETSVGSSGSSRAFAFEMLTRCEAATLRKLEDAIGYSDDAERADFSVGLGATTIGVAVVRAVTFPPTDPYEVADAQVVLTDKLGDILQATANVDPADAWVKQVLVVMAWDSAAADSIVTAWDGIDEAIRADTIVYVVVTDGEDEPIYFD